MAECHPPTAQEIVAGGIVAGDLRENYNVRGILIMAAKAGYITELRCGMPYCFAPDPGLFDPNDMPRGPWMPTHEHFPLAKKDKGKKEITNAVLAHRRCNNIGYKLEELREYLQALPLVDGGALRPEAIDAAMDDNIGERKTAEGCYPRKSGSRKRAVRIARQVHESMEPPG